MEKANNQKQKISPPVRTKIAGWIIRVVAILVLSINILFVVFGPGEPNFSFLMWIIIPLFQIVLSSFLLKGEKWAWIFSVFLFSLATILFYSLAIITLLYYVVIKPQIAVFSISQIIFIMLFLLVVLGLPLILLLLDRRFYREKV